MLSAVVVSDEKIQHNTVMQQPSLIGCIPLPGLWKILSLLNKKVQSHWVEDMFKK
jgi:hypothetical protein